MSSLQIGRLVLGPPPSPIQEPLGDPVGTVGGAVVPAARTAPGFQIALATSLGAGTSVAQGQALRRRVRSLLNNSPLKLQGYLYVVYSDDGEVNGWYVPEQTQLAPVDSASWLANGLWQIQSGNWFLAGHRRTHREARSVWMKDLRTNSYQRDTLGWLYSTDFAALPMLALTVLPNGAGSAIDTVSGKVLSGPALPAGRDGGVCQLVQGLSDLTVVSYERGEGALNLSDVIVYDRRGAGDAPASGAGATWEEVYGPDYPWNWLNAGQPTDCPVLDNGLVRVRWDATNKPGFRVDVWNGSAYVEQGKMLVARIGDTTGFDDTFVSAGLWEYTPDRAVISVILSRAADASSRERVLITMQRGTLGATFEVYPALKAAGTQAGAELDWCPAPTAGVADVNDSVFVSNTQTLPPAQGTGLMVSSVPTGNLSGALGLTSFTAAENYVAILRCPTAYNVVGPYQVNLAVVQAANANTANAASDSLAYGVAGNKVLVYTLNNPGYLSADLTFSATAADQINEAETIRNAGSGTTSQVADAAASGGQSVKDTQTAETNPTLQKASTSLLQAKYHVFARVKVDTGATGSFRAALNGNAIQGPVATSTSTSWVWLDLGELLCPAASPSFQINAWRSAGVSGAVYVDRCELFLAEDRTRTAAIYSGCRDAGQAALADSRALGALTAR